MQILETEHKPNAESTFLSKELRDAFIDRWKKLVKVEIRIENKDWRATLDNPDSLSKLVNDWHAAIISINFFDPKLDSYERIIESRTAYQPATQCSTITVNCSNTYSPTLPFLEELFYLMGYTIMQVSIAATRFGFILSEDLAELKTIRDNKLKLFIEHGYVPYVSAKNRRTDSLVALMFKELKL